MGNPLRAKHFRVREQTGTQKKSVDVSVGNGDIRIHPTVDSYPNDTEHPRKSAGFPNKS